MNIGIITTWFPAGAGYVSKAYREVLEQEHNVFIYARGGKRMEGDSLWDDERVTWAPRNLNGIKIPSFLKWIKSNNIEIIFFNEQRFWKPVLKAKEMGVCVGAYVDYYKQSTIPLFGIYDFLICNTQRHYSVFKEHRNCHYVPWGVDVEQFKPKKTKETQVPTFIISAGWEGLNIGDRRGALLAAQAFIDVKGNCKLKFFSQVPFDDCLPIWKEVLSSDPRIEFIYGTIEPFPFEDGDVYLYPSRLDGIGLSLPEAIASGLPAITTDCAPMNEFVIDGYNGTLVEIDKYLAREDGYYWAQSICNIKSITEAIQSYVDHPQKISEQSLNARDFALKKLNWTVNAANLNKVFKDSFNAKSPIKDEFRLAVKKIDRLMAPSLMYRFLLVFHDLYFFYLKRS